MICLYLLLFLLFYARTGGVLGLAVKERSVAESGVNYLVYEFLQKGDYAVIPKIETEYEDIKFFCHPGTEPSLFKFWTSASFNLEMEGQEYKVYIGPNVTVVNNLHQQSESSWWYSQFPWRSKQLNIDPFQSSCVGVKTARPYRMSFQLKNVNFYFLIVTICSTLLYFWAPTASRNVFFHYATGVSAGVLLSVLILTFLVQRKFKAHLVSWISIFYSLSIYCITLTWYNLKEYLTEQYFHWVVGYVIGVGLLSFAFIYRMGAPSHPRTLNLIQWTMQGMSLLGIVLSSYYQVASLSLALVIVFWSWVPAAIKSKMRTQVSKVWYRPKVKLLSEEEYQAQRNENTRKALEDLRNFCRSPESKPWKTVTRLHSPSRFAEFVEGSPHITEQEIMDYSHWDSIETDDENSRSDITDDDDDTANRSLDSQRDLQ